MAFFLFVQFYIVRYNWYMSMHVILLDCFDYLSIFIDRGKRKRMQIHFVKHKHAQRFTTSK